MIPLSFIEDWEQTVPWQVLAQVEQDLVISRALVDLFNDVTVQESLVFRGGTALNKIYLNPPARYSEDIDLVMCKSGPVGDIINTLRNILDRWLGEPKRTLTERSVKLIYKYVAIGNLPARLKIEINTTENFQVLELRHVPYAVHSEWYSGKTNIITYHLEELMATKLRALYQRRKGRDLFDLWLVLSKNLIDIDLMIQIFLQYCVHDGNTITREAFYQNMMLKHSNKDFRSDMYVLLPTQVEWDFDQAFSFVQEQIISKIPS